VIGGSPRAILTKCDKCIDIIGLVSSGNFGFIGLVFLKTEAKTILTEAKKNKKN